MFEIKKGSMLSKIKYPKFLLLLYSFFLAYMLFANRDLSFIHEFIASLGYFGTFIAGALFTYGFTTPLAIALFLVIGQTQNIFVASFIGGIGALIGDIIIFKFLRLTFKDEIAKLRKENVFTYIGHAIPIHMNKHSKLKNYLTLIFAGFIIASPLPDELGISMLAIATNISERSIMILSYLFNTIGILVMLAIGSAI